MNINYDRFQYIFSVWKLQYSWRDLVLVEKGPSHQNFYILKFYHHKFWLILFCILACSILFFGNYFFPILHPNCGLIYGRSVVHFIFSVNVWVFLCEFGINDILSLSNRTTKVSQNRSQPLDICYQKPRQG